MDDTTVDQEQIVKPAQIARDEEEEAAVRQWEAERAALQLRRDNSRVYFIEAVGLDLVKIGYAHDVQLRIRSIETGCPVPVKLLGTFPGGPEMEKYFHTQFAEHRSRREWFRRCPDIDKIIANLERPRTRGEAEVRAANFYRKYRSRPLSFGTPRLTHEGQDNV